jgi:hypothetical protein
VRKQKRPAPAQEYRPSPDTIDYGDNLNRLLGLQRTEPLTRDDREDIELLIRAAERGFRLSTSCVDCGHPISLPSSVRRHRGPKCHAKAVTE